MRLTFASTPVLWLAISCGSATSAAPPPASEPSSSEPALAAAMPAIPVAPAPANPSAEGSPVDPGYTVLTPSADTKIIYVSSSTGDDSNDGLSPERPVRTVKQGKSQLRDGFPDWLLFKRGDVWNETLGRIEMSGRSKTDRMVYGAYGEGPRPRFEFRGNFIGTDGGGDAESIDNVVFTSLDAVGVDYDPERGTPTGAAPMCVGWCRGGRDVLFEDMRFQYCGVVLMECDKIAIERVRIYRSLFLDAYSANDGHSSAIYLHHPGEVTIEESVFDRCGWNPKVKAGDPTMFNHCIYWQGGGPADGVVKNNIIMRASSHGTQLRSSGRIEGNVYVRNAIGAFLKDDFEPRPTGVQGTAIGNLWLEAEDITPREGHPGDEGRGWGFELLQGIRRAIVKDNIVAHCRTKRGTCGISIPESWPESTLENNIVWDWRGSAGQKDDKGPFVDPERSVASYNGTLGGEATFEAFANEVRKQSKTNWRKEYTAQAVNAYIRAGFERKK